MTHFIASSAEYIAAYTRVAGDDDYRAGTDPLLGGYGIEYDPDDGLPLSMPGERGALAPVEDVIQTVTVFHVRRVFFDYLENVKL